MSRRVVYNGLTKLVKLSGRKNQMGQSLESGTHQLRVVDEGGENHLPL